MRFRLDVDGEQRNIEVEPFAGGFVIRIEGASYRARTRLAKDSVDVRIGAKTLRLQLEGNEAILDDGVHHVRLVELSTEGTDGVVHQVAVSEGETVTADRVVASIELRGPSAS